MDFHLTPRFFRTSGKFLLKMSRLNDVIFTGTHWHPIATLISTLLKLEISTLLKTITNSCFQALEGLKFQALEGLKFQALEGLKSNAKADESNYLQRNFCFDFLMILRTHFEASLRFRKN